MILKLEAAKRALAGGVAEVRIVGGTLPRALLAAANAARGARARACCPCCELRRRKPRTERRDRNGTKRK